MRMYKCLYQVTGTQTVDFIEVLPKVYEAIDECLFMTFDGEFTGLNNGMSNINLYDTTEERYKKLRHGAMDFLLCQFGLCTFTYNSTLKKYFCKAFNFFVFPRPFSRQAPDQRFQCQSSSIDFLSSQGFDFNKVFHEGIPYLTKEAEELLRNGLEQKHQLNMDLYASPAFTTPSGDGDSTAAKSPAIIPDEQKEFVDSILSKVEEFLDNSTEESMDLEPCSAFQRKLIYQTGKLKFGSRIHLETKSSKRSGNNRERYIVVSRIAGEDDLLLKERRRQAEEVEELNKEVGFSQVIKRISDSGKILAGHNMLLDVMHTIHQFIYNLPDDYGEFKSMTNCIFPRILDTKLMASTHPFKDVIVSTALGDLQKILEREPFVKPTIDFPRGFPPYSTSKECLHEAGYDAFVTGLCFITMCNYFGKFQDPPKSVIMPSSHFIEPFLHKINMMRVADIPYMNLAGPDLIPCRDNVYHITFPCDWKTTDLFALFSPYGPITIGWINDTSAFIGTSKKENESVVMGLNMESKDYKITPYYVFKNRGKIPTPSSSRKRSFHDIDFEIPSKRKALNAEASSFVPRSLKPIVEDEELTTNDDLARKLSNGNDDDNDNYGDSPVGKRARVSMKTSHPTVLEPTNNDGKDKVFEEPSW
ncbi:poly(A)-specific ribonuclease PARN-like isoform X2 [Tubulanus polymorphus]|uniref:poly(A)-specific ribonuclease PARN-like isoform X2 n=1 Tax=Tubulanus polymorphus TaxID=672921 RepID=UPI003DA661B6